MKKILKEMGVIAFVALVLYVAMNVIFEDLPLMYKVLFSTKAVKLYLWYAYLLMFLYVYTLYIDYKMIRSARKTWSLLAMILNAVFMAGFVYVFITLGSNIYMSNGEMVWMKEMHKNEVLTLLEEESWFIKSKYILIGFHAFVLLFAWYRFKKPKGRGDGSEQSLGAKDELSDVES